MRWCVRLAIPLIGLALLGLWAIKVRGEGAAQPPSDPLPLPAKTRIDPPANPAAELQPVRPILAVSERLVYDIRVNGVPAGKTQFEVRKKEVFGGENGPEVFTVTLETRSNRAVSLFYEVRDRSRSMLDAKAGFSRFYHLDCHEGELDREERISFKYDYGNMEATYERARRAEQKDEAKKDWRRCQVPLLGKALDPLSALYYLRCVDLKAVLARDENNRFFFLPICADRRVWNTKIVVSQGEPLSFAGLKKRPTVRLAPEVSFQGLFERKGDMAIQLDAETNIPVRMVVEVPIGTAEVVLDKFSGCPLLERSIGDGTADERR